jgi:hypothetical protein
VRRGEYWELELDAQVERIERCAKVGHWKNSNQHHLWLATALVDIEPRLRTLMGYHLPKLRDALKRELKIETKMSKISKRKSA